MKGQSLVLVCALAAVVTVSSGSSVPTKQFVEPLPENTVGKHLDLVVEFFAKLYLPLFEGAKVDPTTFYDFTYDFTGVWSEGNANITNSIIIGTSNFERRLTINPDRREVGLHISFPQVRATGNYSLARTIGGCVPTVGCSYIDHTGLGGYSHTFTGVSFDALYTLENTTVLSPEGTPAVRYSPNNFSIKIDGVSFYADNYKVNGVPQTNWDERNEVWLDRYITSEEAVDIINILFGEATALVMNYSSRVLRKSFTDIYGELLGFGAEIIP